MASAALRSGPAAAKESRPVKLGIRGLAKRYGDAVALAPTDLDVPAGEFLTLLGPSGSGKTTLLMCIAGLTPADAGRIWIDGRDATAIPVYDRDIGMVFQSYALFPHLSVFENVAFALRMRGMAQAVVSDKVRRALDLVRLTHLVERYPQELSGGQQQRVAIARSIVYEPSIILMDEPLGALDKRLREGMQFEIKRLHREIGITVIYVTHDQEEAMAMSDRVCLMNAGHIEQIGAPAELYFAPCSLFAASFLGESNILNARRLGGGAAVFETAGGLRLAARGDTAVAGAEAAILVRPESLSLSDETGGRANRITARIGDVSMLGPLTRLELTASGGERLIAKVLTRRTVETLAPGAMIDLYVAPEDAIVLPPAKGAA